MEPCQLVQHQGEVPGGDAPRTPRSVSVNCPRYEQDSHHAEIYWSITQLSAMTDLVDPLEEPQFLLPLPQRSPAP